MAERDPEPYNPQIDVIAPDEQMREKQAISDHIQENDLNVSCNSVYEGLSPTELNDIRHNARRTCLERDDFSKYLEYFSEKAVQVFNSKDD